MQLVLRHKTKNHMTAFRSSLLVITMLLSLTAIAQKDTIIINQGKTIYTKIDTFKIGSDPSNIERILIIKGDTLTSNKKDSFIFKADKIVMGKTTILSKIDTVDGKQQKTVEISVSGEGLGKMIEKQIDFFTNRDKKPGKKVEGFDLFKTEKLVEGFDLFKTEKKKELKNIENFWCVLDLGFSGYTDQSNYSLARTIGFVAPNIGKDQLKLNMAASRNVNLWILMQRVNLVKHMLNLKYGVGLEMNNYYFEQENIQFQKNPTALYLGMVEYNKVKLAADYITVPMMLNLNTSPGKSNGLRLSAGVSAGFLYSSRFKTKEGGDIVIRRSDFDLEPFKFAWVGELGLGPITLYSSFAMNNMWNKGLDMRPYNVGIRLGARPEKAKTKTITSTKKSISLN